MSRFAVLDQLSDTDERAVLAVARRRRYRRNETIFHEGDPGDVVHLIDKGHVATRVTTLAGETVTIRVLGPGDHFGEMAVLDPEPRSATMVALDAVETLTLHRDVIEEMRSQHPSVDRVLLAAAVREVRRLTLALTEALHLPAPKRLARQLLSLDAMFSGGVVPLTQDDLAGLCGTTRQTVNQVLNELQAAGAIEMGRGKVQVVDADRIRRAAR